MTTSGNRNENGRGNVDGPGGIRAEIAVGGSSVCQVADLGTEATVSSVRRSAVTDGDEVVIEFTVEDGDLPDDLEGANEVFSDGSRTVYRLDRRTGQGCPCARVERFRCPVREVRPRNGHLLVTFIAPDVETLRSVIEDLRDRFPDVGICRLVRSGGDRSSAHLVSVDRSVFTDRQFEVLRTAHEMGYFARPKRANAGDVSDELGIAPATFAEHLAAAQTKLMDAVLDDPAGTGH